MAEGHQNGTTESSNSAIGAGTQNLPLSADKDIGKLGINREMGGGMYHGGRRNQGNLEKKCRDSRPLIGSAKEVDVGRSKRHLGDLRFGSAVDAPLSNDRCSAARWTMRCSAVDDAALFGSFRCRKEPVGRRRSGVSSRHGYGGSRVAYR